MSSDQLISQLRILAEKMGAAAIDILAALTPDQRAKAVLNFDDHPARTFWHYTPIERQGLPLNQMDYPQQRLVQRLVSLGLSRGGYVTAATIMGLETTLDFLEGWTFPLPGRDARWYYLSFFGTPDAQAPWGWKFEGHHISLNYTMLKGQIISPTPTFFGANPAEAPLGLTGKLRPLGAEEDLARELIHELNPEQRAAATIAAEAPTDMVTTNRPQLVSGFLPVTSDRTLALEVSGALRYSETPQGLAAAAMQPGQQEILHTLLKHYLHRLPDVVAEVEGQKLVGRLGEVHFAWAGGIEKGQPHYYRLQGSQQLIEYDNTQNNANHIHSVWRDPQDDFGARLLARHYAESHRH